MAQRPAFDISKLTTADKILLGGSLLFFIDTFLPWQRVCVGVVGIVNVCGSASAWGGSVAFLGILAGLCAILLLAAETVMVMGVQVPVEAAQMRLAVMGLTAGTLVFGLIKFIVVLFNHVGWAAFVGLILMLGIAYAGWTKYQEAGGSLRSGGQTGGGFSV